MHHPDASVRRQIAATFSLDPDDLSGKLSRWAADFLTGGWLETFFWGLLDRHAGKLGCWDVRTGLEVERTGEASGNELDVAFLHEHRLSMIECKSGSQAHDRRGDILYKVAAVALQFRALRVQSYLATMAPSILEGRSLKRNIRTRADVYNCRVLTAETIRSLAQRADEFDLIKATLFGPRQATP